MVAGWLGTLTQDVTKEEADQLGWEASRGAKVIDLTADAPAAAAGLQVGDVIVTLDGVEVENTNALTATLSAKGPGAAVKLRLMRAGKERTVTVTLGAPHREASSTQLMPDTGGHLAYVRSVAFTPGGKQIVSASIDKTVRVWDIETGKTVRIIRGEAGAGSWGAINAMALSTDGRWLAVGGLLHHTDHAAMVAIRLYDFSSGRLETLLKGHDGVLLALAFSADGKRLISGSSEKTASSNATRFRKRRHSQQTERDVHCALRTRKSKPTKQSRSIRGRTGLLRRSASEILPQRTTLLSPDSRPDRFTLGVKNSGETMHRNLSSMARVPCLWTLHRRRYNGSHM